METAPFRFGISLQTPGSSSDWAARARAAEDQGYNVIQSADHLGMPGPFLGLLAAAQATNLRVGTYLLNAGLHAPAYLARDVADLHRLTDGRFEMGIGAGFFESDYQAADLPFGTPGSRLRTLERVIAGTRELLAAEQDKPNPPLMIGGAGKRILELAARTADIVSFPMAAGLGQGTGEQELTARVDIVRQAAGGRNVELNLFVFMIGATVSDVDLRDLSSMTGKSAEQLAELPGVLIGSPHQIADTLRRYREELGINYISVTESYRDTFAEVIAQLT
ncbi:TIGR03621 family F420-dependent LLM class oxidoreductase [Actinoplanes sp. NPDC051411]|uniref:TIGR03621 family F420-dependent LLM class oxidoreductase n=1 Tax=Actinoplanes sp. NPDC051411 TaxID=3155522 RepID=UPI0034351D62